MHELCDSNYLFIFIYEKYQTYNSYTYGWLHGLKACYLFRGIGEVEMFILDFLYCKVFLIASQYSS